MSRKARPSVTMTIRLPVEVRDALIEAAYDNRMEPGVYVTPNRYAAMVLEREVASRIAQRSREQRAMEDATAVARERIDVTSLDECQPVYVDGIRSLSCERTRGPQGDVAPPWPHSVPTSD